MFSNILRVSGPKRLACLYNQWKITIEEHVSDLMLGTEPVQCYTTYESVEISFKHNLFSILLVKCQQHAGSLRENMSHVS